MNTPLILKYERVMKGGRERERKRDGERKKRDGETERSYFVKF